MCNFLHLFWIFQGIMAACGYSHAYGLNCNWQTCLSYYNGVYKSSMQVSFFSMIICSFKKIKLPPVTGSHPKASTSFNSLNHCLIFQLIELIDCHRVEVESLKGRIEIRNVSFSDSSMETVSLLFVS